jgi:hypothetical protein
MQENNSDKGRKPGDLYTYGLKKGEIAARIAVGYDDLEILRMYKYLLKKPMLVVVHEMIVTAVKCWENEHNRKFKEMEEKLRTQEDIIVRYIRKFGRLKPLWSKTIRE